MQLHLLDNLLEQDPVISEWCNEPKGDVLRSVRFMTLSMDNIKAFWHKARNFPLLFGKEIADDFSKFLNLVLHEGKDGIEPNGLFYVIDDFVGLFYLTNIVPKSDAIVHYTFFDKRQKGRLQLTKSMLAFVFNHYDFRRLTVETPAFVSHITTQFILDLGFVREGRRRKSVYINNDWYDVECFGILKEEALSGH